MQRTMIAGVAMWSRWQPDRNMFFNSYFVEAADGNILVDPLPLDEGDTRDIVARGGAAWIVVTNRDHTRDAKAVAETFGAKIAASEPDCAEMPFTVDRLLRDGDTIGDARVIALEGLKTAGEFALFIASQRTVLVGDALWGDPAGSLRLMPSDKLADPLHAARSLRTLRALDPLHILVGDGTPVFERAYDAITAALEACSDAYVHRINLDELRFIRGRKPEPEKYRAQWAEIGLLLGAQKLGYAATILDPGVAFCPTHWHTGEEELFIVWEGTPTLESPNASIPLRRGDLVALPTRAFGAHKLINHSDAPATILMVANTEPLDVCFYPDSKKLLVEETDTLVRSEPILDYFEGE